jgi:hypothetical protein
MLEFLKSRSKVKVKGSKSRYQKCLITRNTHVKYESPIIYHSKDMANVKVFAYRQTDRQNNRQTNRRKDIQAKYYKSPIFQYRGINLK